MFLFYINTNMHKTIKTPAIINIAFFSLLILPILVFLSIKQVSAGTDKYYNYCDHLFNESPFVTIDRQYTKLCNNRFQYLSNKLKRQFINQYEYDRRRNTSN